MPALQVRDFPEELYEELRVYAAKNHRSMAQQTIAAVEQQIHDVQLSHDIARGRDSLFYVETPQEQEERMLKRQAILARAAKRAKERDKSLPSPVTILAECRAEREAHLDEFIPESFGENSKLEEAR